MMELFNVNYKQTRHRDIVVRELGSSTKNFCKFVASSANYSLSRSKSSNGPSDKIIKLLANKELLNDQSSIQRLIGLNKNSKNP